MKILFLCASLDPGRDGVADYTARLAKELAARGQECLGIAMNDRHANGNSITAKTHGWMHIRLSAGQSWRRRIEILRNEIGNFQPDWVSLQFVPYGFNQKGLPFLLPLRMAPISRDFDWQIMFHELWVEPRGGLKKKILSQLQKTIVAFLVKKIRPKLVHTSNPYYASRLESAGIRCGELPLFGNIPVVPHKTPRNPEEWVFVFFGSLRRGWEPEPLLSRIDSARAAAGKKSCRFFSIGRLGEHGESVWEKMKGGGYENFSFEKRGKLPPADISRALQSADFGIAVSPWHLLGKSGAVAAMREHGLPVIVNRLGRQGDQEGPASTLRSGCPPRPNIRPSFEADAQARWFCQDRGGSRKHTDPALTSRPLQVKRDTWPIILLDENFEKNLTTAKRTDCQEMIGSVTDQFLSDLEGIDRPAFTPAD